MAVPGRIVDLHIEALVPDDFRVSFTVESGEEFNICGRELYAPLEPLRDAFDIWALLVMQNTPIDLLEGALKRIDPDWEMVVAARRPHDDTDRLKVEDLEGRRRLREEFQRQRGSR